MQAGYLPAFLLQFFDINLSLVGESGYIYRSKSSASVSCRFPNLNFYKETNNNIGGAFEFTCRYDQGCRQNKFRLWAPC